MAKILIGYSACPLTREAFERFGHDVWTCDLLPARDNSPKHFECDIWDVAERADWAIGIFHPMCTVLTTSGAWAFEDPNFERWPGVGYHQRVKPETLTGAARREQQAIELDNFRRLLALPYPKAIENPAISYINTAIRPPDQCIHPHQFGDDASKNTGLWLDRLPKLLHTKHIPPRWCLQKSGKTLPRWANQTDGGCNNLPPGPKRWLQRSATYPGIADAMGSQWGSYVIDIGL